jgi:hypothetical protein
VGGDVGLLDGQIEVGEHLHRLEQHGSLLRAVHLHRNHQPTTAEGASFPATGHAPDRARLPEPLPAALPGAAASRRRPRRYEET